MLSKAGVGAFLRLAADLYRNHPNWVQPLTAEFRRRLDPKKSPFLSYGSVRLYVASDRAGKIVGRIAVILNPAYRDPAGRKPGFFGLFECINSPTIARILFDRASEDIRRAGGDTIIGPVNLNTNEEIGLLIEGFDDPPMIRCNYALRYYGELIEGAGFEKAEDFLSLEGRLPHTFPPRFDVILARASSRPGVSVRHFDRARAAVDVGIIRELYNECFREVTGFFEVTGAEATEIGRFLLSFSDERLVWIAEYHGKPVGMILAVRDLNEILIKLRGRLFPFGLPRLLFGKARVSGIRVMLLGVLPSFRGRGIEAILIHAICARMLEAGYVRAEFSVVAESNMVMRKQLIELGFTVSKRYRLYRANL